jgi:hypothetical protein
LSNASSMVRILSIVVYSCCFPLLRRLVAGRFIQWLQIGGAHHANVMHLRCCAVLCCAVLFCVVLCCAALCCAALCCAVLCCAVLCCAVLCCAVLCCAVLCCAARAEGGSIGIVFDEGEEEDTVVIDSIKPGTPAKRRYGGQLEEGMLLSVCRGQVCSALDFDAIIALITDPKRPLEMTFEFQYEDDSDG